MAWHGGFDTMLRCYYEAGGYIFILSGNTILNLITDHGGMETGLRKMATALGQYPSFPA